MISCVAKVILYLDTPEQPKVIMLATDAKQLIIHAVVGWRLFIQNNDSNKASSLLLILRFSASFDLLSQRF